MIGFYNDLKTAPEVGAIVLENMKTMETKFRKNRKRPFVRLRTPDGCVIETNRPEYIKEQYPDAYELQ